MPVDSPIRAALLGNGFARTVMLPGLKHVPEITAVGIASPNLERAQATAREFGIEHVAADHRDLLRTAKPELVLVVTPPHRHLEMSRDALMAGCHVVCEKPTALSAKESAAMVVAATAGAPTARGGKPLALIDHELRFDPRRIALRQLIREGRLGDILHASYILHTTGRRDPSGPWTWWSDAEQGGGMWGAVGSHAIDALRVLLGEVAKVRGRLHTFVRERTDPATGKPRAVTSDDYAAAWLELRSGVPAAITVSAVEGERRHELTITGSRGIARLAEGQPLMVKEGAGDWREAANDRDLAPSAELKIPDTDWARAFIRYARAIAGAIRSGEERLEGAADFADGHRNQVVLDAVRKSATADDWVAIPGN